MLAEAIQAHREAHRKVHRSALLQFACGALLEWAQKKTASRGLREAVCVKNGESARGVRFVSYWLVRTEKEEQRNTDNERQQERKGLSCPT